MNAVDNPAIRFRAGTNKHLEDRGSFFSKINPHLILASQIFKTSLSG